MQRQYQAPSISRALWQDEAGLVLSAELIIIVTVVVLGLITGLACLQQAVVGELQDVGWAIRGMNQSYATTSFFGCRKIWGNTSWTSGSRYYDSSYAYMGGGYTDTEIGAGRYGRIIDSAPQASGIVTPGPVVAPEQGCTTCPPAAEALPIAPIPMEAPCATCTPTENPGVIAPQPDIPMGPAPQIQPQM